MARLRAWDAVVHHSAFATMTEWSLCFVTALIALGLPVGVRKVATVHQMAVRRTTSPAPGCSHWHFSFLSVSLVSAMVPLI